MKSLILVLLNVIFIFKSDAWIALEKFNPENSKYNINHNLTLLTIFLDSTSHCFGSTYEIGNLDKGERMRLKNLCAEAFCEDNRDIKISGYIQK